MLYRWYCDKEKEGSFYEGALGDGLAKEDWPTWNTQHKYYLHQKFQLNWIDLIVYKLGLTQRD